MDARVGYRFAEDNNTVQSKSCTASINVQCWIIIGISLVLRLFYLVSNDLLVEEAYYWNYAQNLDYGYLDHPPMVAWLIYWSTACFGVHEWSVRLPALLCWSGMVFFSFRLSNLIKPGAGIAAAMLLSILPFFFVQSLVMTPDQPLLLGWSASLYYLYQALIQNNRRAWYAVGFWLGVGLLAKYTIVILGGLTAIYLLTQAPARHWLRRKEPYLAAGLVMIMFTPVVLWNANHQWASFAFQGSRRIHSTFAFSLPELLGLLILFLTPLGCWGLVKLAQHGDTLTQQTKRFLQIYTFIPLLFFGLYSVSHEIKFNWIGPGLLAIMPWLAWLICQPAARRLRRSWTLTAALLITGYTGMMVVTTFGVPEILSRTVFKVFIDWQAFTQHLNQIAQQVDEKQGVKPVFVPLDRYNIGSELTFYQAKLLAAGRITRSYPVVGRQVFGGESLMFEYWGKDADLAGQTLIMISNDLNHFDNPKMLKQVTVQSPVETWWAPSQGRGEAIKAYYYQIAKSRAHG